MWQLQTIGYVTTAFDDSVRQPTEMDPGSAKALGIGFALAIALLFLKLRFIWWPLHPIAFPISYCAMISYITLIILVTWAAKSVLMRYGGLRAHRAAVPLFVGLLVGGFSASVLNALILPVVRLPLWLR